MDQGGVPWTFGPSLPLFDQGIRAILAENLYFSPKIMKILKTCPQVLPAERCAKMHKSQGPEEGGFQGWGLCPWGVTDFYCALSPCWAGYKYYICMQTKHNASVLQGSQLLF